MNGPYYVIVDTDSRMTATCCGPLNATGKGYIPVSEKDYQTLCRQPGPGAKINPDGTIASLDVIIPLSAKRDLLARTTPEKMASGVYFQPSRSTAPILFPTDSASYTNTPQQSLVVKLDEWEDGTPWTLPDGSTVPMTGQDVTALCKKITAYRKACQAHAADISRQLDKGGDADITAGWPDNH
ncbi:DUF4376 domain-containing protein [Bombella sp. TMW 2.2559]|uniref:DUF4376 domain-containing protein n=1 Tax=Bombella dulcis TaxID=2967339 RepID=A0ABT3WB98_9PROT|nr:DUF4376 domain-containing protein [Bombella dulcis]MCX5616360.1 DUF4376 domain-containing protein [Bombella dulcis]